jgi:tRNA nucleotidyltransferase (CCA-adding enzyme)
VGPTLNAAFEQAALALTSVVTDPAEVSPQTVVEIECEAPDDALLLTDWLNGIIYQMALRKMLFSRYSVAIDGRRLTGRAWGEPVDRVRHTPAVEPKGATFTSLDVRQAPDGTWTAQCVVDV